MDADILTVIPSGPGAGLQVAGLGQWGLLGAVILASSASGTNGPGLAQNDTLNPALSYVYQLESRSAAAVLLFPNSSHQGPVPYSGTIRLFEEGTGEVVGTPAQRSFSVSVNGTVDPPPLTSPYALDNALSRVLPYVQGCPTPTARFHILQAAIEFFQRTATWREELLPIPSIKGQSKYVLPVPIGSVIAKVLYYSFDGVEQQTLDADSSLGFEDAKTTIGAAWSPDRSTLTINPAPGDDGLIIKLKVALKPAQDGRELPSNIYEHFIQYICFGAIGSLLMLPKQSFTDFAVGSQYREMFQKEMHRHGMATSLSYSKSRRSNKTNWY